MHIFVVLNLSKDGYPLRSKVMHTLLDGNVRQWSLYRDLHAWRSPAKQPANGGRGGGGGGQKVRTSRAYVINRFLYILVGNINFLSVSLGLCILTSVAEHQPSVSSA